MADGLNIPSGEGLLAQQQEFAAQEPYKNIAANPTNTFMNAFLAMSQINGQRRKLEQQLQMAYLKNDLQEREFGLKMDNANAMHAIAIARLGQTAAHQNDMLEMAGRGMELREAQAGLEREKFNFAVDKQNDRIEGTAAVLDVFSQLGAEGIDPKNPKFFTEASSRLNSGAAAKGPASTVNKALAMAGKQYNDASDHMLKDNLAKTTAFSEDVGRTIFGDPKFQDLRPVLDYQNLPDETTTREFGGLGWIWGKPSPPPKPTGNKIYTYQTSAGPQTAIISTKKLADLNKQYSQIMEERKNIHGKVDTSAYDKPEAETLRDRAMKIAVDPSASSAAKAAAEQYLRQNQ